MGVLADFFTFGGRKYVNNAIATAHALDTIISEFGDVTNFRIKFRKPILSKAEFVICDKPTDGNFIGNFDVNGTTMYFGYTPVDIPLDIGYISVNDIYNEMTMLTLCYYIAENTHQEILSAFEKIYGQRGPDDKSIFVMAEIYDTDVMTSVLREDIVPKLEISVPFLLDDRKFKLSVSINNRLLGHRYNTVKKFIL